MHAQLSRDRADRPAFSLMQAQDLRLEDARDHRWTAEAPLRPSSAPAPEPLTDPLGQRGTTERANIERRTALGARGGFAGCCIGGLALYEGTDRHDALGYRFGVSVMRHFVAFLSLPLGPPELPGGVAPRTAAASLIPALGPLKRLMTPDLCAVAGAVHVAVIAALTNADLDSASLAVVEPVPRLAHRPQRFPPEALDSARAGRHKGPAHCLSQALRIGGPGE